MSFNKSIYFLLFFSLAFSQDAFLSYFYSDLKIDSNDLQQVFMNESCLSPIEWPSVNISNYTFSGIIIKPKSIDLSGQDIFLDRTKSQIVFTDVNASLSINFNFLFSQPNETLKGKVGGKIAILNITNHKDVALTGGSVHFFTTSLSFEALDLSLEGEEGTPLKKAFMTYYEQNVDRMINTIRANMTSCLNNWLYLSEDIEFFKPYLYKYRNKMVNISYQIQNLILGDKFLGFSYKTNIYNFTREKNIPLSQASIVKELKGKNHSINMFSKSLFINLMEYYFELNAFDINLNDDEFYSEHFYYYIGEIALFAPEIRNIFYADEKVSGNCRVSDPKNVTYNVNFYFFL